MKTADFDYALPDELIAQTPLEPRDHSRLLVLDRATGGIEHRHFYNVVDYLRPGDVLVMNDSRVIPARLKGKRQDTGGKVELLLLHPLGEGRWECLANPARSLVPGTKIVFGSNCNSPTLEAEITCAREQGIRHVRFSDEALIDKMGSAPLPPYIHTPVANAERYQTVYARNRGSAAAPTAGLHFTPELLEKVRGLDVSTLFTTLHIGLDTFQPVHEDDPRCHQIHREFGCLTPDVAGAINRARDEGRRIISVGTTSVRIVEHAATAGDGDGRGVAPFEGWVSLFILPGHRFKAIDALITNFHLPRSTLLMLVSAFAGKELIDRAYQEAINEKYRFYSFGDAMLIM